LLFRSQSGGGESSDGWTQVQEGGRPEGERRDGDCPWKRGEGGRPGRAPDGQQPQRTPEGSDPQVSLSY